MKNWKYIEGAKTGNEKAISSTFYMNDYGVEVGQWSWDWRGKAPDEKKQNEIAQKIKSYVQQINKNVPAGDSDERDEVFSKLDKFVRSQGLNKKIGNIKNDAKAKELHKKMMDAKEIAGEWGRASNYQKKDNLEGGRKAAEDEYRKAKKAYEDYAMNSKTGNEKTGAEEFFKQLSDDVKEREDKDDADIEKVGNSTVSEYNSEIQRLTKKAEQLRRMGQGRQAMEVEKQIEKLGKELSEIGNSAPDDKFAYVMREFDEGKLKTPDGKVVTDPAQAKAIAYSESKKTENGLARARKAMNKGITMWKGNDSAYIKEDGTVSYLENNSFETDKDKFESQESAIKELSKQGYGKNQT